MAEDTAVYELDVAKRKRLNADPAAWQWSNDDLEREENQHWKDESAYWIVLIRKWREDDQVPSLQAGSIIDMSSRLLLRYIIDTRHIYIRQSYIDTVERLWVMAAGGYMRVVITGQPGIGKTLFLWYFLIRLVQDKQVVLLHMNREEPLLFYHDKVYSIPFASNRRTYLPEPLRDGAFIWSLFDVEMQTDNPPSLALNPSCVVIQAPSPHEKRVAWAKNRLLVMKTALPLWTRAELLEGISAEKSCTLLKSRLSAQLKIWPERLGGLKVNHGIFDYLRTVYSDDRPTSANEMLGVILDRAIDIFGFVPRDVFSAVFDLKLAYSNMVSHATATPAQLEEIVAAFRRDGLFSSNHISHRIICINPSVTETGLVDSWSIAFKSSLIGAHIARQLEQKHREDVRNLYRLFRDIPEASSMLGNLFEVLAHRTLMQEADANSPWTLSVMNKVSDAKASDEPTFTAAVDRVRAAVSFPKMARKREDFSTFPEELESGVYYMPEASNFPLIDSFTIDIDTASNSATLWLFQMTNSRRHKGSRTGYKMIRDVMTLVKKGFAASRDGEPARKKAKVGYTVTPRYVLVCPVDPAPRSWKMPRGWSDSIIINNHQGEVYLLETSF